MKRYALDALVMAAAFVVCLLGLEVFHTWQRVNILWNVAIQNAQAEQARTAKIEQAKQAAQAMSKMSEAKE